VVNLTIPKAHGEIGGDTTRYRKGLSHSGQYLCAFENMFTLL